MRTVLKKLCVPYRLTEWYLDLLIAIPQIIGGALLLFVYGPQNMGVLWKSSYGNLAPFEISPAFVTRVRDFGGIFSLYPKFFAGFAASVELYGGLLLILGLYTRLSSFFIFIMMVITILFREFDGSWSYIPVLGFLALGISGMIMGSGRFGLDYLISKKNNWV